MVAPTLSSEELPDPFRQAVGIAWSTREEARQQAVNHQCKDMHVLVIASMHSLDLFRRGLLMSRPFCGDHSGRVDPSETAGKIAGATPGLSLASHIFEHQLNVHVAQSVNDYFHPMAPRYHQSGSSRACHHSNIGCVF